MSMCDNLMSEAERTVMAEVGAGGDARRVELVEAVQGAVEQGWVLMKKQAERSVEEFNDDSEYSKMLQEAVQVRALPLPGNKVAIAERISAAAVGFVEWSRGVGFGVVEAGADSMQSFTCKWGRFGSV